MNTPFNNKKAFGLALQALAFMSRNPNHCASGHIADHLCSEASLMRRIMAKLVQENLVEVREGRDGGYRLKQPPESITFADVFAALQSREPVCLGMLDSTGDNALGEQMRQFFTDTAAEIEQNIRDTLSKRTIADLATKISP